MVGNMYFKDGYTTETILGCGWNPNFYCFTRSGNYMCKSCEILVKDNLGCVLWVSQRYTWYKYSNELEDWLVADDIDHVEIYMEE